MKLLILFNFLLQSVLATSFAASNSVVLTAKDVAAGITANQMGLTARAMYRAYAVYASTAFNADFVSNINITGADGTQFSVAELADLFANTYFLDARNVLQAPITITDFNTASAPATPYTIYLVSADLTPSPVISAQYTAAYQMGCGSASACTVLSAEKNILLSEIYVGTMNRVLVTNTGFDSLSPENTVLTTTDTYSGSSVMISGPIATVYAPGVKSPLIQFTVDKTGKAWNGSLPPGASTSFLSDGWLSVWDSYNTDYVNENARTRSYDFGKDTQISFNTSQVGNFFPKNGDFINYDSFTFTCTKADGQSTIYDCGDEGKNGIWCKTISIDVVVGKKTNGGPRFNIQVDSVSGAFSLSIFTLLISSLFASLSH